MDDLVVQIVQERCCVGTYGRDSYVQHKARMLLYNFGTHWRRSRYSMQRERGFVFLMHGSGGGGRWGRIDVSYRRLGMIEGEICEGEKDGVMFKGLSRSATGPAPHDAGDTI